MGADKRLEKLGKVDLLLEMREPHDWSKAARPKREEVEPIDMMEELASSWKNCSPESSYGRVNQCDG